MVDGAYDVFISYRRENGAAEARLIRAELERQGWQVFLDVEDLNRGYFDQALLRCISDAPNFVIILSPGCLERCSNTDDWLRQEIAHAISTERNIVPVLISGFSFPSNLDESISPLQRQQGVEYSHKYFTAMVQRIVDCLVRRAITLSPYRRMLMVLTSPRKAWTDLERDPSWWVPWLVLSVMWVIYAVVADGRDQAAGNASLLGDLSFAAPVLLLAGTVIVSTALMALFKLFARRDVTVLTVLTVVMYSLLPEALRVILSIVMLLAGSRALPSNLAYFLPADPSAVAVFASAVDAFRIWSLVLATLGFASILRLEYVKTAVIVVGCYLVCTAALAALTQFLS
jgi:hypothetical protein